jgi:hypothetical protein
VLEVEYFSGLSMKGKSTTVEKLAADGGFQRNRRWFTVTTANFGGNEK